MRRFPYLTPIFFLLAVNLVIYSRVLGNGFVGDDLILTIGNPAYRDFMPERLFLGLANGLEYLPVRDLSLALDYRLWGESPGGFHATNLLIHLAIGLAAYWTTLLLARRYAVDRPERLALMTALFFSLHPLQAETVGMLTCRNAMLAGLFSFLSVGCYLRFRNEATEHRQLWFATSLLCFFLAIFSKATSITLPLLLLTMDLIDRRRSSRQLLPLLPFFLTAGGAFALFRAIAASSHTIGKGADHGSIFGKLAVALQIPFFYLHKLLLPIGLGTEYPDRFITTLLSPTPMAALCGLTALMALLLWFGWQQPMIAIAAAWFGIFLLPVLNLFNTYPTVADRYLALSSYGFCLLLAWTLYQLGRSHRRLALGIGVLVILSWSILTALRLPVWRTELSYWQDALTVNPENAKAIQALGVHYYTDGQLPLALKYFAQAQAINPGDPMYDFARGDHELLQGNAATAIPHLLNALNRKADCIMALFDLGEAYATLGQREKAIDVYRRLLRSTELDPQGYYKRNSRLRLQEMGATP